VASCLLYRTINCEADAKTLQKDLDTMQQWEAEWLMEFNPNKCMKIRKGSGPNTVPWGTSDVTSDLEECFPSSTTSCFRFATC
jgi:hypothetical protein